MLTVLERIKIEEADPLETVIDPEGDLRLVVGPDEHSIIVSSKILCVASERQLRRQIALCAMFLLGPGMAIRTLIFFPMQIWKSR